jgi:Tfp pilus assembly protein PilX
MFLNVSTRVARSDERGAALIAVIGIMAIGLIVSATILTSLVSGIGFTSSTRANVQAQAAAEAGIADARAGLDTAGNCTSRANRYNSVDNPLLAPVAPATTRALSYVAEVSVKNASGTWVPGCPGGSNSMVRIVSTGFAANSAVASSSTSNRATVEAIYAVGAPPVVEGPSPAAVYMAGGGAYSSFNIASGTGSPGDFHVLKGDFNCNGGGTIEGSVIVADGGADITNTCLIKGSLKVSKGIAMSSNVTVEGDVVAAGGDVTFANTSIRVKGNVFVSGNALQMQGTYDGNFTVRGTASTFGSLVKKDLWAGGKITLRGQTLGNVTSASTEEMLITPGAYRAGGNLATAGPIKLDADLGNLPTATSTTSEKTKYKIKVENNWVGGTVGYNLSGLTAPPAPVAATVAPWVDFVYRPADWPGYNFVTWPAALCEVGQYNENTNSFFVGLKNTTTPTVVDTRACEGNRALTLYDVNFPVKTNLAFIGGALNVGKVNFTSADGAAHKLWFLVPDGNATTAGPQCVNGPGGIRPDIKPNNGTVIGANLTALAYTPCTIELGNGSRWRGQLYGGNLTVSSGDSLTYLPIGIPGTDLSGGGAAPGGTPVSGAIGNLLSSRNVSVAVSP